MSYHMTEREEQQSARIAELERELAEAKRIANNALYFADNSDYRSAFWDICETLGMKDDEIGNEYMDDESTPATAPEGGGGNST